VLVAFCVIVAFALFGRQILGYLNISLPALQGSWRPAAAPRRPRAAHRQVDEPSSTHDVNVAMVPLGTPLLAGPGAIVAIMVFVTRIDVARDLLAVALGVIGIHVCCG
jgi:multiple antibiotic resistance protein